MTRPASDSYSWVGCSGTPSGVPTFIAAAGSVKVTAQATCVGLP